MLAKILDAHYRRPKGFIGRYVGRSMARDHRPENLWTVGLLQAQPTDHILELGFGPGFAICELAKVITQGHIAGVDFSPTMVAAARNMMVGTAECRPYSGAELAQMLHEAGFRYSDIMADTNSANHSNYTVIGTK